MTSPESRRFNVGARKIPYEQRDVAHAAITPDDDRGYLNIIGADDDPGTELGADVTYSVVLTDVEVEAFRAASNARYVEADETYSVPDPVVEPADITTAAAEVPESAVLGWLDARQPGWDGAGVIVAVLDGGTTRAVRDAIGATLVARANFSPENVPDDNTITSEHGCWVAPLAVPRGGKLIDAITCDNGGSSAWSSSAAAMRWAADLGAKVVNFSSGGSTGSSAMRDAARYLADRGVVLVASAGNGGRADFLSYPARYCEELRNVKSSIAFTLSRVRAGFSDHKSTGSGCAPGEQVLTWNRAGQPVRVSGTSFSAPLMSRLIALGLTGGRYGALAVAEALETTARNTAEPAGEEGRGAWNLRAALESLGALNPPAPAGRFFASRWGSVFHRENATHWFVRPSRWFESRADAVAAGLRPYSRCRP